MLHVLEGRLGFITSPSQQQLIKKCTLPKFWVLKAHTFVPELLCTWLRGWESGHHRCHLSPGYCVRVEWNPEYPPHLVQSSCILLLLLDSLKWLCLAAVCFPESFLRPSQHHSLSSRSLLELTLSVLQRRSSGKNGDRASSGGSKGQKLVLKKRFF